MARQETNKPLRAMKALAVTLALLGAGAAQAGSCSVPPGALTGVLESPGEATFSYLNTSGQAWGVFSFGLFGCGTLDGAGPDLGLLGRADLFELTVNGNETMYGFFRMGGGGQSSAWLDEYGRGGGSNLTWSTFSPGFDQGGTTLVSLTIPLLAGNNALKFRYYTDIPQGINNEGWGVTSFTVTPVPEPGTWGMLLAGLGLVGAMARRRRA